MRLIRHDDVYVSDGAWRSLRRECEVCGRLVWVLDPWWMHEGICYTAILDEVVEQEVELQLARALAQ